jgi:urease subunit gamma/beta
VTDDQPAIGASDVETANDAAPLVPGEVLPANESIVLNAGASMIETPVTNTADRPIQVGSHYHFFEVNRALRFDRSAGYGRCLDIAAGAAVRFEPGETRPVRLIPLGGRREVWGCNGLVQGALEDPGVKDAALARARERGFSNSAENDPTNA